MVVYMMIGGYFTCFALLCLFFSSRLMIASSSLFPKLRDFGVGEFDMSDHLPLYCSLRLDYRNTTFRKDLQ